MEPIIHILHLEDDPIDAELVQATLAKAGLACRITRVQTRDEFESALRDGSTNIIIADYRLPTYDGMSALRLAHERCPEIPFIFVSGAMGEEAAIGALTQGATDYVLKHNLSRLAPAVKRALQEAWNRRERRQAQEALKGSNEMLRAIFEAAPVAIIGLDLDGHVHSVWNPAAEKMLGWNAQEVMGRQVTDFMQARDAADQRQRLKSHCPGMAENFECRFRRKDGQTLWALFSATPIFDNDHRKKGAFAMITDITDRKLAEADLYRLNQELERRVAERTQELEASRADLEKAYHDLQTAHSRMLQQEKMASIGQMAAGVAHEINNPLAFIISNLGTFRKYSKELAEFHRAREASLRKLTAALPGNDALAEINRLRETMDIDFILEDIEQVVAESLDGGARMKDIVKNLKSFARLDEAEYKMADLNQGLESTLNIVWNELKYKARVTKSYGELPQTMCNPGQLNQVFMNILVNAAQAIEHQGEIDIVTRKAGDAIVIEISDTGCGIPPDKLNRIFEPFFTTKEVGKGTGLGLSIVYDIVEKHGGEIAVDSRPGHGTRFTISLPIRSE
ncbi:MAG: ATP-binding protein [Pseudomonadota bacterium]